MAVLYLLIESLLVVGTTQVLWRLLRRYFTRTALDNLPGPPAQSFWKGNVDQYFGRHGSEFQLDVAQNYGPVVKLQGLFGQQLLYVYDLKALHSITVKDQHNYEQQEVFAKANYLVFGPGLLSTLGEHHRRQRKMLNPVFSVANLRKMLPIFYTVTSKLRDALVARVYDGPRELDVLSWMGRTALELIGQGGLGCSLDPLVEDRSDPYVDAVKDIIPTLYSLTILRQLVPYIGDLGPAWFRRRIVELFPHMRLQKMRSIVDTITQRSVEIYEAKKATFQRGDNTSSSEEVGSKDIMSILMRANMETSQSDRLLEEEVVAQMTTFIFAAMDTTSNSLARILEHVAQRPDIQEKVRQEVLKVNGGGGPLVRQVDAAPWLDAICRETLRVDPPDNLVIRQPTTDVVLPLSEPVCGIDGTLMHEIPIPKGTQIIVGVLGCNTNKAIWGEDALEWKPERWLSLPSSVAEAPIPGIYSNLMTFLGGGRGCIGFKFSELEMKVVLSVLLSSFTFELTEKPIVWNVASVRYPTVGSESTYAEMPLRVGLLRN